MGKIVSTGIVCPNIIVPCGVGSGSSSDTPYAVIVGECDHKAAPHDSYGVIVPGCGSINPAVNQYGDPWLALTVSKRGEVEVQFGTAGVPIQTNGVDDAVITIDGIKLEVHWDNGRKAYRTRSDALLAVLAAKVGLEVQVSEFEPDIPAGTAAQPVVQQLGTGRGATAHTLPVNPNGSLYIDISKLVPNGYERYTPDMINPSSALVGISAAGIVSMSPGSHAKISFVLTAVSEPPGGTGVQHVFTIPQYMSSAVIPPNEVAGTPAHPLVMQEEPGRHHNVPTNPDGSAYVDLSSMFKPPLSEYNLDNILPFSFFDSLHLDRHTGVLTIDPGLHPEITFMVLGGRGDASHAFTALIPSNYAAASSGLHVGAL